MFGIGLLFFYFSGSIFFCTLALFSTEYTGGGIVYGLYIFLLALFIGILFCIKFVNKIVFLHEEIKISKIFIVVLFLILFLNVLFGYLLTPTDQSVVVLQYFVAFVAPSILIGLVTQKKDITNFFSYLKYLNIYLSICVMVAFLETTGGQFSSIGGTTYLLIGYTMASLFIYNFICFLFSNSVFKKLFYGLLMTFNVSMVFISGSRGALISLCIVFLFMCWRYIYIKSRSFYKNTSLLGLVILIISVYLTKTDDYNTAWWRISLLFREDFGISSSGRDIFFTRAMELFNSSPLYGNGVMAYTNSFDAYVYPHNLVLEILSSFGIIGILVSLFVLIILILKAKKMLFGTVGEQFIVLLLLHSIVMLMFSGSYLSEISLWIPLVLVLTFNGHSSKRTRIKT